MKKLRHKRIHHGSFIFLCLFCCECYLQNSSYAEKCSRNYKMQNLKGDYILGGFVPAHLYNGSVYKLNFRAVVWASAILYAIREINNDKHLLPGVHLGYDIRDSCQVKPTATQYTLDYLLDASFLKPAIDTKKYENMSCIERGNSHNTIFGVVGAYASPISTVINNLLGVDFIPQVSYGSTSTSLSDPSHRSFIRTVPSDIHQADAIVDLLMYFDWTYVSAFVEDDEYGRVGLDETRKNIKKRKLCLAGEIVFNVNMTRRDLDRIIAHLQRIDGKSHVVIIWSSVTNAIKIMLESQRRNIGNITWIGTEAWGTHSDLKSRGVKLKENIIGLEIPAQPVPAFTKAFKSATNELKCTNPWFAEYLLRFKNVFPSCDLTCEAKITGCQRMLFPIVTSIMVGSNGRSEFKTDQVLTSVYALAHGLHKSLNCTSTNCSKINEPLDYYSIYKSILDSEFRLPASKRLVKFDSSGEILDVSYNFKFLNPRRSREFKLFASWKLIGSLVVNKTLIDWGIQSQPIAHCSRDCGSGYYRVNGSSSCCWSCPRCFKDSITKGINKYKCENCSRIQITNENHTRCVDLRRTNMQLFDYNTILLLSLALFGFSCTVFVISVFIKYWDTPIIKSTSREMSCIQLVSILLLFAFPGLYFVHDSPRVCTMQMMYFSFLHSTFLALILVKTYRLLLVFRERFTSVSKFLHNKYQIAFAYIFVLVISLAVMLWYAYFPTELRYEINRDKMTYYTSCGDDTIWFAVMVYLLLLEIVITAMAFRARKLPENFNEVQFIVFTMFTDIIVWLLVSLALYTSLESLAFSKAFLHVNFTSNMCRLVILYGYRIRIVLFYPELNSPEHFRRTATGTTVTNFVKEVRRDDGTLKRSVTSVVQLMEQGNDSPSQPMMRYSFSSLKQYDAIVDQPNERTPLKLDTLRLSEPASAQPSTSPVFENDDTFHDELFLGHEFDENPSNESSSSSRALTPDIFLKRSSMFQDIKKWASSQLLSTNCSDEYCKIPRSSSVDCLDCRNITIDREHLEELLLLRETIM